MEYLNKEEIERAKRVASNIADNLKAVMTELSIVEKPYKNYLTEKLESILWDTNCLIVMCKEEK